MFGDSLLLINESEAEASTAKVMLAGKPVSGSFNAHELSAASYLWNEHTLRPEWSRALVQRALTLDSEGRVSLPPLSATVVHLDQKTEPAAVVAVKSYASEKKAIEDQRGFHANIAFMDHQLDRILEALKAKSMLDNAWIVFFSDQGVMSGAHGLIHKSTLYRQITQPSLIIRPPSGIAAGKRLSQPVELMDLLPTFLEIAGVTTEQSPAGVSLTPLFKGETIARTHSFAEIEDWIVVSDGHHRLIRSVRNEGAFLFDDIADPENLKNIAPNHPEIVKSLGEAIDAWLKQTGERLAAKTM